MDDTSPADRVLSAAMPLLAAAEAAAALGATLRLRHDGETAAPASSERLAAVLDALGIRDDVDALDAHETEAVLGIVASFLAQATDLVTHPTRAGWQHDDPSILIAQGHSSALVADLLKRFVIPSLGDDLTARLQAIDAAFLDVGTGVAALAVAMCRHWPSLKVVGIDPFEPALTLAREQVATARLQARVELRRLAAEALRYSGEFDLAWVPTFFIPDTVLDAAIVRVHAALRPGGWATLGVYARPGIPFIDALADLRTVRHGGALRSAADLATSLKRAGFTDVAIQFSVEWSPPMVFVVGRRADAPQG